MASPATISRAWNSNNQAQDLQAKVAVSVDIDILSVLIFQRKEIKREFESGR
ncbi:MAG: hypothetical protein H7232_04790 [Aeromicrobium sp.]|nr:hypothetical protein [Burkholderiales bacterium]